MIKRINITIDEELLNRIDSYSKKSYLSRSGLISLVLSTYLNKVEKDSNSFAYDPKPIFGHVEV